MSYKSTRRQWVKLWVNEWLDGTTRFELTAAQRLLWVDLLALAGRSRFPGFIYAGTGQGNEKVGYPIAYLAGVLQMDETDTNNALKLLESHGHITLSEVSPEKYIIGIVNWEKYQSEYLRQKGYRKVTTKTTSRLPVEVEGEEEVEGEKKKIQNIPPAKTAGDEFAVFWEAYPKKLGRKEARAEWIKAGCQGRLGEVLASLTDWKRTEQWKLEQYIPYPQNWIRSGLWLENPHTVRMRKPDLLEELKKLEGKYANESRG